MIVILEIARGLAALWVFMFHFNGLFSEIPVLCDLTKRGGWAVTMFFVISGFVITYSAESSRRRDALPSTF